MSHFVVYVVTEGHPEEDLGTALQPYHEFECTGIDDEYVVDVDTTEKKYKGYVERHSSGYNSFKEYLDSDGYSFVMPGEGLDLKGRHQFGYVLLDGNGEVVKVVNRTNPNSKWDWWNVGGRWTNRLLLKDGSRADCAQVKDIDFEKMISTVQNEAEAEWRLVRKTLGKDLMGYKPLKEFENEGLERDEATDRFFNQPAMRAYAKLREANPDLPYFLSGIKESLEDYVGESLSFVFPFAFVVNGEWIEKGRMGWFCTVANEIEAPKWYEISKNILQSLKPDSWLTVVDCHI